MADGSESTISVLREELEGMEDREERSPELSEIVDEAESETSTRELMKLFHGFMENMAKASGSSDTLMDKGRMVDGIPPYKDGAEISKFVMTLETELREIGVSKGQYKRVLLSKLTPKVRERMADVIDESACTYERLKEKLLERIGLSRRDLDIKMFNDLEEDCRGMVREARYKHRKVLIDRVLMTAKDKYEVALFVAKGLYRVGLPISEQGLIDSRPINAFSDLADVAISLKAANSRSRNHLRTSRKDGEPGIRCLGVRATVINLLSAGAEGMLVGLELSAIHATSQGTSPHIVQPGQTEVPRQIPTKPRKLRGGG